MISSILYVCMYVCPVCMYVCMYACPVCMYVCIHVCPVCPVCMYVRMYVCMYVGGDGAPPPKVGEDLPTGELVTKIDDDASFDAVCTYLPTYLQ